jgi:hypothetical protein
VIEHGDDEIALEMLDEILAESSVSRQRQIAIAADRVDEPMIAEVAAQLGAVVEAAVEHARGLLERQRPAIGVR